MITRRSFLRMCTGTLLSLYSWQKLAQVNAFQDIPVLLYHRVGYTKGHLTVSPERFRRDLVMLQDYGYHTITLAQFHSYMSGDVANMPDRPILLTFDDGYADNYENAYFTLLNYGMVATFFIITGLLWTPGRVSPENILEMRKNGMSFGSHTMSHRSLAELSASDVEDELNSSRTTLESILGVTVDSIAYPRGSYNSATIKSARQNGYRSGFTTISGRCCQQTSLFELRRIPVFDYSPDIISIINTQY